MSAGKFIAGFVVGGAVGAVLGILLAPQSGEETREIITEKSGELYKNTEDSIKDIQCKANAVMSDMQQKGDELLSKVQDLIKQRTNA